MYAGAIPARTGCTTLQNDSQALLRSLPWAIEAVENRPRSDTCATFHSSSGTVLAFSGFIAFSMCGWSLRWQRLEGSIVLYHSGHGAAVLNVGKLVRVAPCQVVVELDLTSPVQFTLNVWICVSELLGSRLNLQNSLQPLSSPDQARLDHDPCHVPVQPRLYFSSR